MTETLGADVGGHLLEQRDKLGRRVAGEQARKGGIELLGGHRQHLTHALDPGTHFLLGQRSFPAGVGVDQDQRRDELGMVAVELQYDGATPGEAGDVRRAERNRVDQRRKAVRVVREAEIRGHVRGAARPRLVPGNDGELVRQGGQLRLPHATVHGGTVYEHQRRPFAGTLIGDLEPVRPNDLHRRNVHPAPGRLAAHLIRETARRASSGWNARRHPSASALERS